MSILSIPQILSNTTSANIILRALSTHRRKHEVLQQRVKLRAGKYKYAKNANKLFIYHSNEVSCCDFISKKIVSEVENRKRKEHKFLSSQEMESIDADILKGKENNKTLAIKYGVCYTTISKRKINLGLGRKNKIISR